MPETGSAGCLHRFFLMISVKNIRQNDPGLFRVLSPTIESDNILQFP